MMSADHNQTAAKKAFEARLRGDWDAFFSIFDKEAMLDQAPSLPYGGAFRGIRDIRRGVDQMLAAWDFVEQTLERITAGGEIVIGHLHMTLFRKETGIIYGFPVLELCRFRAGKIIEWRPFHWDTHRINQVFGKVKREVSPGLRHWEFAPSSDLQKASITDEEAANLTIVKAAYEKHAFFAAADDSSVLHEAPSLPYGGDFRGVPAMQRLAQRMRATWGRPGADGRSEPTLHKEVEYTVGGDLVCAHMMFGGKSDRTGTSFSFPIVEVFRFRRGLLSDITVFYFDTQTAVDCFG